MKKYKDHENLRKLKEGCQEGLAIKLFSDRGRGIVATKSFVINDFVVEYKGNLVEGKTVEQRFDTEYLLFFTYQEKKLW